MRLLRIEIEEFGKLREREFALDAGLNLFEGPNESGKSTLLAFLRFAFYGFPRRVGADAEEREKRLSWQGHRAAGRLYLERDGKQYCIARSVTRQGRAERDNCSEQLCVSETASGTEVALGGMTPGEYFLGLPAALYDSTLCLRQSDAERVASPEVGEAVGGLLFSGPGGIGADAAQEKLSNARRALQYRKGRGGRIAELEDEILAEESTLSRAREDAQQLAVLRAQSERCREQIATQRAALQKTISDLEQAGIAQTLSMLEQLDGARRTLDQKKLEQESIRAHTATMKLPSSETIAQLEGAVRTYHAAEESAARMLPELERLRAIRYNEDMVKAHATVQEKGGEEAVLKDFTTTQKRRRRRKTVAIVTLLLGLVFAAAFGLTASGLLAPLWALLPVGTYLGTLCLCFGAVAVLLFVVGLLFAIGAARSRRRQRAWLKHLHVLNAVMFRTYLRQCAAEHEAQKTHRTVVGSLEAEHAAYTKQKQDAQDYIKGVMQECGFADTYRSVEDLPRCIADLQERRRTTQSEQETARVEMERAAAAVEALAKPLAGQNTEGLRARFTGAPKEDTDTLKQRQAQLQTAVTALEQERDGVEQRLAALRATAKDPSAVQARLELLRAELAEAKQRVQALDLAITSLSQAVEALRGGVLPRVCEAASSVFEELTEGAYGGLHTSSDFSVTLDSEVGPLPLSRFSAGCRDAAHLSMRLGLLSTLCEEKLPLLFDEAFSRLDDNRTFALLSVLQRYCETGGQCLLFSCHSREAAFLEGEDFARFTL